jgi:hypothetical protein
MVPFYKLHPAFNKDTHSFNCMEDDVLKKIGFILIDPIYVLLPLILSGIFTLGVSIYINQGIIQYPLSNTTYLSTVLPDFFWQMVLGTIAMANIIGFFLDSQWPTRKKFPNLFSTFSLPWQGKWRYLTFPIVFSFIFTFPILLLFITSLTTISGVTSIVGSVTAWQTFGVYFGVYLHIWIFVFAIILVIYDLSVFVLKQERNNSIESKGNILKQNETGILQNKDANANEKIIVILLTIIFLIIQIFLPNNYQQYVPPMPGCSACVHGLAPLSPASVLLGRGFPFTMIYIQSYAPTSYTLYAQYDYEGFSVLGILGDVIFYLLLSIIIYKLIIYYRHHQIDSEENFTDFYVGIKAYVLLHKRMLITLTMVVGFIALLSLLVTGLNITAVPYLAFPTPTTTPTPLSGNDISPTYNTTSFGNAFSLSGTNPSGYPDTFPSLSPSTITTEQNNFVYNSNTNITTVHFDTFGFISSIDLPETFLKISGESVLQPLSSSQIETVREFIDTNAKYFGINSENMSLSDYAQNSSLVIFYEDLDGKRALNLTPNSLGANNLTNPVEISVGTRGDEIEILGHFWPVISTDFSKNIISQNQAIQDLIGNHSYSFQPSCTCSAQTLTGELTVTKDMINLTPLNFIDTRALNHTSYIHTYYITIQNTNNMTPLISYPKEYATSNNSNVSVIQSIGILFDAVTGERINSFINYQNVNPIPTISAQ